MVLEQDLFMCIIRDGLSGVKKVLANYKPQLYTRTHNISEVVLFTKHMIIILKLL